MIRDDCFGYLNGKCTVLTTQLCAKGECSFYKTAEELEEERLKSLKQRQAACYASPEERSGEGV